MAADDAKPRRRALKSATRPPGRKVGRAGMCLTPPQLVALHEFLDGVLATQACDDTLRHALAWAAERSVDPEQLSQSLGRFGGYCDCEVLFNVSLDRVFPGTLH